MRSSSIDPHHLRPWRLRFELMALLALLATCPAAAGVVDPRLHALETSGSTDPARVWVSFQDKGVSGPALQVALANAEAQLSPRNRARRLRAHVSPLVDELDLPVCARYLDDLAARGFQPHAVSRWFNRTAVWVTGARLRDLASLPFVERVSPVERAYLDLAPPATGGSLEPRESNPGAASRFGARPADRDAAQEAARHATSPLATHVDYGRLASTLGILGIPAVHDSGYIGHGVLIAILDDGFNGHATHEALSPQLIAPGRQRDFVDGDTVVTGGSHGTLVMGLMAGDKPGQYVGAAFGAEFALARTENDASEMPVEMLNWGRGAEWADSLGADLISSSLGYFTFDDTTKNYTYADMNGHTTIVSRAAEIAASKGILVVNSVGNSGNTLWHYLIAPSDVNGDSLIAVGAVWADGTPASFSSYGPSADGRIKPDLAAPGVDVPVVLSGDPTGYTTSRGTSISAPLVSGIAACIMQARPQWTPQQVIQALKQTASRATRPDNHVGYGVPSASLALGMVPLTIHGRVGIALSGANPLRAGDGVRALFGLSASETRPAHARVRVFDASGRAVRTLWTGTLDAGRAFGVTWDGTNDDGRLLVPGLYWIAVDAAGDVASARVVLLR